MRLLLSVILLTLICSQAFANLLRSGGGMATGGGSGVVCRDENSAVTSVQLLDLHEAQVQHHLTLVSGSGNSQTDYRNSVKRTYELQNYYENTPTEKEIQDHYGLFFKSVQWTLPGSKLPLIADQGSILPLPKGCALEQIAIFHDGDREFIEVQTDLWQRLPTLHQAALIVHELFYKFYRILGDYSSEFTRLQVAHIFSKESKPVLEGLPIDAEICTAYGGPMNKITKFFIYSRPSSEGGAQWVLQFTQLMGRPLMSKTLIVLNTALPRMSQIYTGTSAFPTALSSEAPATDFFPLHGLGYDRWTVKINWAQKKPVAIALYNNRHLQQESYLWGCVKAIVNFVGN